MPCAPAARRVENLFAAEIRVPEDDGRRTTALHLADGLDATRRREVEVDKHDVRVARLDARDELLERRCLRYFEISPPQKSVGDTRPKDPLPIGDDDAHRSYVSLPAGSFPAVSGLLE